VRNVGRKNGGDRWKNERWKNAKLNRIVRPDRNLHRQTSSSTAFRIFATGKTNREREKKKGQNWPYLSSLFLLFEPPLNAVTENFNEPRETSVLLSWHTHPRFLRFLMYISFLSARIYSEEFAWSFIFPRAKDISTVKENCYITCF